MGPPTPPLRYLAALLDRALTDLSVPLTADSPVRDRTRREDAVRAHSAAAAALAARQTEWDAVEAAAAAERAGAGAGKAAALAIARAATARGAAARQARAARLNDTAAATLAVCDWPQVAQPGSGMPPTASRRRL